MRDWGNFYGSARSARIATGGPVRYWLSLPCWSGFDWRLEQSDFLGGARALRLQITAAFIQFGFGQIELRGEFLLFVLFVVFIR